MSMFTRPGFDRDSHLPQDVAAPFGPGRVNNDLGPRRGLTVPHKDMDARREYHRAYIAKHRYKYRFREKAWSAAFHANKRAAQYGAAGSITVDQAIEVLSRSMCYYCGRNIADTGLWTTIDHVIPLYAGGVNAPENIVTACHACNSSKFRGDKPFRWSRDHDACLRCGTKDRQHLAKGLCTTCHRSERYQRELAQRRKSRELSAEQRAWGAALGSVYDVMRPEDWPEIVRLLGGTEEE